MLSSIDLGLSVLCVVATDPKPMSLKDIADVCECHPQRIAYIEDKALKKLQRRQILQQYHNELGL